MHSAPNRGAFRFALPREPESPAGDEAGKQPGRAQHKGLSPGAAAAAAAASLEPPAEAEPAPGPTSPPAPGGGCRPSPLGAGARAPSPVLPRLRWDRAAAQPPSLPAVGAPRSMSEESAMERAIKVRGRCRLPSRFVPAALLSAPASKRRELGERGSSDALVSVCPGFRGLPFTARGRRIRACVGREVQLTRLKRECDFCPASTGGGWHGDTRREWYGGALLLSFRSLPVSPHLLRGDLLGDLDRHPSLRACLKRASWKPAVSQGGGSPSYKPRPLANRLFSPSRSVPLPFSSPLSSWGAPSLFRKS